MKHFAKKLFLILCLTMIGQTVLTAQVTSKIRVKISDNMDGYLVNTPEGQGLWTLDNKEFVPCKYSSLIQSKDFIFGKIGEGLTTEVYLKENGKLLISESNFYMFDEKDAMVFPFCKQEFLFFKSQRGHGVIDGHGKLIVPDIYLSVKNLGKYFIASTIGGFAALYSINGDLIIPANRYTDIKPNSVGCLIVNRGTHVGVCTLDGTEIIPANIYNDVQPYVSKAGFKVLYHSNVTHVGFADITGKTILSADDFDICNFQSDGLIFTRKCSNSLTYLYDVGGNVIRQYEDTDPERFTPIKGTDKKFIVQNGVGVLNQDNSEFIPKEYHFITRNSSDKRYYAYKNGTCTLYSPDGEIIIPGIYSHIEKYKDNYYKVYKKDKCGLCDYDGKEMIPVTEYDDIEVLEDGTGYIVTKDIYFGVILNDGKELIPPYYTKIRKEEDFYIVAMFDKWGVCDANGQTIIPPQYTYVDKEQTLFRIEDGGYCGYADTDGKVLFSPNRYTITMLIPDDTVEGNYRIWASIDNSQTDIYDIHGNVIDVLSDDNDRRNYVSEADRMFDVHNYSSAVDYYTKACKLKEDYIVLYNIGSCYFNMNQYSDAKIYMQRCLNIHPPYDVKENAASYIKECESQLNAAAARAATASNNTGGTGVGKVFKAIGRIALAALVTTAAISSSLNPNTAQMYNDSYYHNPNVNVSNVFNNIMNQTIETVNAQYQEGYNQYRQYHPEATFTDYQIFLGQTSAYQSGNTYNSYSTSSSSSTSGGTSSNHLINCPSCANTGKCSYCGGNGYAKTGGLGLQSTDYSKTCSHCGGSGVCPVCNGHHM